MRSLSPQEIKEATPPAGFFKNKEWRLSPEPLRLPGDIVAQLAELGILLEQFLSACDGLYHDSRSGKSDAWIASLLDAGKPDRVIELGCHPSTRGQFARIIRPDVLLTANGLILSEIDSTPGGIGLTAWLNQLYGNAGWNVIGSGTGMIDGFRDILGDGRVIFSNEALDYRPEIEWIVSQIHQNWRNEGRIVNEWEFDHSKHNSSCFYRYFELWDLDNVRNIHEFSRLLNAGASFTAPMKSYLEEKLWLALLWTPGLEQEWRQRLGDEVFSKMKAVVPMGWVMDPAPIPYHSVYPGLNIQNWAQLADFSQSERQLVLKISGFSEKAWGARGVTIAHDISSVDWKKAIDESLKDFSNNPRILQRFHSATILEHPFYRDDSGETAFMQGRTRLCPYYFRTGNSVELKGVLATICPKEKKVIHGMKDAIMVPCVSADAP